MQVLDKIKITKGDITKFEVDAIVNAANNSLLGGGGVDGAIHREAGPQLMEACKRLNGCETGDAKITEGFKLKAKYVIHTVGPVWHNAPKDDALLASSYRKSLEVAIKNNVKTIAFPSISTGDYRFPFERACHIALNTVMEFLNAHEQINKVYFVMFGESDYRGMQQTFRNLSNV